MKYIYNIYIYVYNIYIYVIYNIHTYIYIYKYIIFSLFFTIDDGKKKIKKPHAAGETSPLVYERVRCIAIICKPRNI